jgi:hypothetical protein
MTQQERLIKYFKKHKSIDPLQAWTKLGIYRLADCVYQLRKKGFKIETQKITVINKFKEDCVVALYRSRGLI